MYAVEIVLGWKLRDYSNSLLGISLDEIEDFAIPSSSREIFHEAVEKAQLQALEEAGFERIFTRQHRFGKPGYLRFGGVEHEFTALNLQCSRSGAEIDATVGVCVSAPYAAHLVDWDVECDTIALGDFRLKLIARFQHLVSQQFPCFASAQILVTLAHY